MSNDTSGPVTDLDTDEQLWNKITVEKIQRSELCRNLSRHTLANADMFFFSCSQL